MNKWGNIKTISMAIGGSLSFSGHEQASYIPRALKELMKVCYAMVRNEEVKKNRT